MNNFKYSLTEVELMMPWEREIYLDMLVNEVKEQNQRAQQQG